MGIGSSGVMRAAFITGGLVALAACTGDPDPVPPPPIPDDCLPTDSPAGVSLEIATDGPATGAFGVDTECDVAGVRLSGNETRLFLAGCAADITTATIAIASNPVAPIAIAADERIRLRYARRPVEGGFENRMLAVLDAEERLAVGVVVGPELPDATFLGPVVARVADTECTAVPQGCFDAVRQAIAITRGDASYAVPSRHVLDDGDLHVRVEQADRFEGFEGCGVPAGWYDFVVTLDRP